MNNLIPWRTFSLKSTTQLACKSTLEIPRRNKSHLLLRVVATMQLSVQDEPATVENGKLIRVAISASNCSYIALAANSFVKFGDWVKLVCKQHCSPTTNHTMTHETVEKKYSFIWVLYQYTLYLWELSIPWYNSRIICFKDIWFPELKALNRRFKSIHSSVDMIQVAKVGSKNVVAITCLDSIEILDSKADTYLLIRTRIVLLSWFALRH